ncbi:hypothetical protein [Rossellomorea vietnamensis]|nr:hypothetical protein [Rossellomorea vietnamensis]
MMNKKKPSKETDKSSKTKRHNDNARAAASLEPEAPRISTDNL